jgi:proteic killer suppression protein
MDVDFENKKLAKMCSTEKDLIREFGSVNARRIQRRLQQLRAATVLEDLRPPAPGRCHELTADRAGDLSLDVDHPYRLIFRPGEPAPRREDGGLDWQKIDRVVVVSVSDTH